MRSFCQTPFSFPSTMNVCPLFCFDSSGHHGGKCVCETSSEFRIRKTCHRPPSTCQNRGQLPRVHVQNLSEASGVLLRGGGKPSCTEEVLSMHGIKGHMLHGGPFASPVEPSSNGMTMSVRGPPELWATVATPAACECTNQQLLRQHRKTTLRADTDHHLYHTNAKVLVPHCVNSNQAAACDACATKMYRSSGRHRDSQTVPSSACNTSKGTFSMNSTQP